MSQITDPPRLDITDDHGIKFSNAYDIIKQKILINKIYSEIARLQIVYNTALMEIQRYTIDISKKRIELIAQLNSIYEKQLTEFTELRQEECNLIISSIDDLSEPNPHCEELVKRCQVAQDSINSLFGKALYLEQQIPKETEVTNYKLKDPEFTHDKCGE